MNVQPTSPSDPLPPQVLRRGARDLFALCFISYAFCYIGRKNLSACLPSMIADGTLTKSLGGYLATAHMLAYGIGQLLSGRAAQRVQPQRLVAAGLLGAAAMNTLMGLVRQPGAMLVVWSLNGLFQSMLWAPIIRIFTNRLPERERYRAGVNIAVSAPAGVICAYLVPAWLLRTATWRAVFLVSGGILFLAFAVWGVGHIALRGYIAAMDRESAERRAAFAETERRWLETRHPGIHARAERYSFLSVMFRSGAFLILLVLFCNGALKDAVSDWAPTFFAEKFGLKGSSAALISVLIPVVTFPGAYIAPWLCRRFIRNEVYTCSLLFAVDALCILGIRLFGQANVALCALFLAVSIASMSGANSLLLTLIPYRFAGFDMSSSVTGFFNCFVYLSSAFSTGLYGRIAEHVGWGRLVLIWLAVGGCGVALSAAVGPLWARKSAALDRGEL